MSRALHSQVVEALKTRSEWEERQIVWRKMRRDGLRRKRKPYPGAADLHFPLISMQVEKLKPFYYGQAFGADQLARFTGFDARLRAAEAQAAEQFDWFLKNQSNFQVELFHLIDAMLVSGRGVMKCRWCPVKGRLVFDALDPLFVIVPAAVTDIEDAPFVAEVRQLDVAAYRACPYYNQDEGLIRAIAGPNDEAQGDRDAFTRAGITEPERAGQIVLWEVWVKDGERWRVETFAPKVPDLPVRMPFMADRLAYVDFPFELAERGWYAAMGVAEHQAPFEAWCCKQWNAKADAMDFYNKPLFTSSGRIPNTQNLKFAPGELMPEGIAAVAMPEPPISFDVELQQTHRLAQEAISMPDANMGSMDRQRDNPTAREVAFREQLSGQGVTMRGMIFRLSLARLYRLAWGLMVERAADVLAVLGAQGRGVLPMEVLVENFMIEPDGAVDTWNRDARRNRAVARMQMFANHPNIIQSELVKSVLEDDDARLVKRLFREDAQRQQMEQEDEAMEIVMLMSGYPATVMPGENHQLRIGLLVSKLQQLAVTGAPVDPVARQRIQEHLAQHVAMLRQENPAVARQIEAAASELEPEPGPVEQPAELQPQTMTS